LRESLKRSSDAALVNGTDGAVAHDAETGRDLYVVELPSPGAKQLGIPATRFGCFLVMNATGVADRIIRELARRLLDAGAAYFATWGPDCERVHDLIDAERPSDEPGELDVVMTTWHEDVDLDEAIWESVFVDAPAGRYADGCDALVAVVVDDPVAASRIRRRYADLQTLCRDVRASD
jgi:hypothetical protein